MPHPASMTAEELEQVRRRFGLQDFSVMQLDDGASQVFVGQDRWGRPAAAAYSGKSLKPTWSFWFTSEKARKARIDGFAASVAARHADKQMRQQARKQFKHSLKEGDIFVSTWGYDQTNVDWYQVVRTSPKSVWIQRIQSDRRASGRDSGDCWPKPDTMFGPVTRHRVSPENRICIDAGYRWADLAKYTETAEGRAYKPVYWSSYA